MFAGKPIIGIVGGVGSGKSFVADLFARCGCLAIHSDKLVNEAYNDPDVRRILKEWWGDSVLTAAGAIDRQAISARVFAQPEGRRKIEQLLHPLVAKRRQELMETAARDSGIVAFVWDSPLLLEAGLRNQCDAVVFVHAPPELRLARVSGGRGWDQGELSRRENLQWPLDRKREISEYVIDNTADADYACGQVKDVLSRIRGQRS